MTIVLSQGRTTGRKLDYCHVGISTLNCYLGAGMNADEEDGQYSAQPGVEKEEGCACRLIRLEEYMIGTTTGPPRE